VALGVLDRLVLSDAAWERMAPLIIGRPDQKGSTGRDNRLSVEGVLWIVCTGAPYATFRNAPGVGSMLKEGRFSGEFALPESRVPPQIFTSGAGAAERVRSYLAASGSGDEVADFAAYTMRQSAEGADGTISARAYQNWTHRYRGGPVCPAQGARAVRQPRHGHAGARGDNGTGDARDAGL
jgi:hypothetical protein